VRFEERSIYALGVPDDTFDLTVCRHVLQAIPHTAQVLAELVRVTRPGGHLHLIAEDYGMIHFQRRALDADAFWNLAPRAYGEATGTDVYVGRNAFTHLRHLGLRDITVDYVVVDPLRAPRETIAAIFAAWRDGYAGAFEAHTPFTRAQAVAHFDDMLATLADPDGYAVWHVPVIAARVPWSRLP
jgi:SAM-dependent methyltransferase